MARIITYDILGNLTVEIRKSEDNPATVTVIYEVKSIEGQSISESFEPILSLEQTTQLRDLIKTQIIPQIKTKEGI